MVNKMEVDLVIGMIQSLISMLETYSPSLKDKPIIKELNVAIAGIQALGI